MPIAFDIERSPELDEALADFMAARLHSLSVNRTISAGAAYHTVLLDGGKNRFPDYASWEKQASIPDAAPEEAAIRQLVAGSSAPDFEKEMLLSSPVLPAIASQMEIYPASKLSRDPYYKHVRITKAMAEQAGLSYETGAFEPCSFALRNAPLFLAYGLEIPRTCMFSEEVRFPIIGSPGAGKASVTPVEMETIRPHADEAHGRVLCCGSGLGYYAFHAHLKQDVESVAIIEKDKAMAELLMSGIVRQFPYPDKISVIHTDPIAYLDAVEDGDYETIFMAGWQDYSGIESYLASVQAMKRLERTAVSYWIEDAILGDLFKPVAARVMAQVLEWPDSPARRFTGIDRLAASWGAVPLPAKRAVRAIADALRGFRIASPDDLKALFTTGFLRNAVRSKKFRYSSPYGK